MSAREFLVGSATSHRMVAPAMICFLGGASKMKSIASSVLVTMDWRSGFQYPRRTAASWPSLRHRRCCNQKPSARIQSAKKRERTGLQGHQGSYAVPIERPTFDMSDSPRLAVGCRSMKWLATCMPTCQRLPSCCGQLCVSDASHIALNRLPIYG